MAFAYYFDRLSSYIEMEKSGEDLHMNFPLTIATIPFRIPNSPNQPTIEYGKCDHLPHPLITSGISFLLLFQKHAVTAVREELTSVPNSSWAKYMMEHTEQTTSSFTGQFMCG
jgi:hypothetical protein